MKHPDFDAMAFALGICAGGPLGMLLHLTLTRSPGVYQWLLKKANGRAPWQKDKEPEE